MPTFGSFKDLEKYINSKINDSLQNEVSEKVKDVMQDKIETEVYDAYTSYSTHPDKYVRREEDGGLKDRDKMDTKVDPNTNTLTVENVARMAYTGYLLAGLIEYGDNAGYGEYDYFPAKKSEGDFRVPRPFIEETRNDLKQTGEHVDALKKGLKRNGITVE